VLLLARRSLRACDLRQQKSGARPQDGPRD
jgi:hypothetical protein